jgi:hypothetical protein
MYEDNLSMLIIVGNQMFQVKSHNNNRGYQMMMVDLIEEIDHVLKIYEEINS